ncbi:MAG: fibrobacter succinogenes major paralogous domain-containing protein [Fibromonadaceae bacterium]|jgi:uncharacterized protein (TIGR02145 family)|nr:fibrobacter succinogenes major paralogous domain-containing protein [Fibromonadaceae bacterium]
MKALILSSKIAAIFIAMALTLSCSDDNGDSPGSSSSSDTGGGGDTFTDSRDNQTYKQVKIGEQIWMAENLNYNASGSVCHGNAPAKCDIYGRLYDWETATKVCPEGWSLPSNDEWTTLTNFVGTEPGKKLKATNGWINEGNGTDVFGFAALPGGGGTGFDGNFPENEVNNGFWWSATEYDNNNNFGSAYFLIMEYKHPMAFLFYDSKKHLFSVRCLKN